MDIIVSYKIGDIVKHSFNEEQFKVVGYNYMSGDLKYICLQSEKTDILYMSPCELMPSDKQYEIGFKTK